jgi:hypothetical protein
MKITGSIRNQRTKEPIPTAHIVLSVGTTELAGFYSDKEGLFEYEVSEDYKGQILICSVDKEGFKAKAVEQELKEERIILNIELEEERIEISGVVRNQKDNKPIEGVSISLKVDSESLPSVTSNSEGKFRLSIPSNYLSQTLEYTAEKKYFKTTTGMQKIERKTIAIEIRLEEKEIRIRGVVCNQKDKRPIEGANISFKVDSESFPSIISDNGGGILPFPFLEIFRSDLELQCR